MRYKAVLMDADGTLFDFEAGERVAIREVVRAHGVDDPDAVERFHRLNEACWRMFERNEITQARLRTLRFELYAEELGLSLDIGGMSEMYMDALARQSQLLDGALDTCRVLSARLPIALVTNGIGRVQRGRLKGSLIEPYISALVISEDVGHAKPHPQMLFTALEALGLKSPGDALMVGDSLKADIKAANNAGMDVCWINAGGQPRPDGYEIQYEVASVSEVVDIVLPVKG